MNRTLSTVILTSLIPAMLAINTRADELSLVAPVFGSNVGVTIASIPSGGAPWVVKHGFATLTDDGRLRVDVRGLIIPGLGTAGPVTEVAASVVCSDAVAATSAPVPLSTEGDAEIQAKLKVPSPCFGTVILVRIAGLNGKTLAAPSAWIAASGVAKDSDRDE